MRITRTFGRQMLMATAATGLAMSLSMAATAQETDESAVEADSDEARLDVVTVTGIRGSIANSIAQKRSSDLIVEAISSEDIGKLPDNSIAESLARLPGLAAQRLRGRAQQISVRGLGPDFTTTLLNGREQVTAGDNRGVEFDQYPSEILSSVLVYKTPDAALLGQGLAGTADLRTIRPLDYSERQFSLGARYEWNEIGSLAAGSDDTGYRITGTYVDQYADGTVGLALAFATQDSPSQAERFEAWGYPLLGTGEAIIGGAKPYNNAQELERTAFAGTLQFEPTPTFRTSVDVLASNFKDNGVLKGVELPLQWSGAQLQPGFEVTDRVVTAGVYTGVNGVIRNDFRGREADIFSIGGNAQFDLNDLWTLEADLSFSSVERDDVDVESYTGLSAGDTIAFSRTGDGEFVFGTMSDYTDTTDVQLADPGGWGQVGFIKRPSTDDELSAIRLSAKRDFGYAFLDSLDFGVNYTQREKTKRSDESFLDLSNPDANGRTDIPANLIQGTTSLHFLGGSDIITYDPLAMLNAGVYTLRPNVNPDVVTKSWDVQEDVTTFYAKANINTDWGSVPVRGNYGLQFVQTEQQSQGARVGRDAQGNIAVVAVDEGDDYSNVLPSLNLSFEVAENHFVRVGAARTLARARLDQIRASQEFGIDSSLILFPSELAADPTATTGIVPGSRVVWTPNGGNPALQPYIADSFDISYEWYFGNSGYFSAAAFYKDLKDFVFDGSSELVDFSGIVDEVAAAGGFIDPGTGLPVTAAEIRALNPGIDEGILSRPDNGEGGHLQGLEFAVSLPGDLVFENEYLAGLGVLASVSFTDSEIVPTGQSTPIAVPGLSETVGNVTLYWEYGGFEARVSNRYRDDFLGEITGFGANREFRTVEGESVVDAQIGYEFQDGMFDGLTLLFQAENITDEEFITTQNSNGDDTITGLVRDYQRYGANYRIGLNYRF